MTTPNEGHSRPETGPPGGIVDVLSRWESAGGHWRILKSSDAWVTAGLYTCGGDEEVSRVTSTRTAVLTAFLAGRTRSDD